MSTRSGSRPAALRILVALQVMLIVATLFAPIPAAAADDPSADPSPTPSAEPTPTPDPTPEATPEPSSAPTPTPTPAYAPSGPPSIESDQADYPPGGTVTLAGSNWQAGENVHIYVNDDWGSSWSRNVDVIADAGGVIQDQFNLPDWFVATYTVIATGELSGTAVTTFTDGNVKVSINPSIVTATITATLYSSSGCTGSTTPKSAPGTIGVGSSESLRLDAATTGTASTAPTTRVFLNWTVESGVAFTIIPGTSGRSICISGDFNGGRDAIANYIAGNAAPVANDDTYSVAEDGTLTVAGPGVLTNDTDADSNPLTVGTPRPASGPSSGTLTLNTNGSFTYVPDADFSGNDSFTYFANDGTANSAATATVTITVTPVDDAPAAVDDSATVAEDSGATTIDVLANDTDIDGGPIAVASVTQSANGTVVITGGGTGVSYEPAADYCNGGSPTDDFTYTLNGGSTATVEVTVTCVNDDPVANHDSATVAEDSPATSINVLANDNDGPDSGETLSVTAVTDPPNGTATFTAGGVTYTPDPDYNGPDSFTYTIGDGNGGTAVATVSVTVTEVNDTPDAVDDDATVAEDDPFTTIDVEVNDSMGPANESAQSLSVTTVSDPANGTALIIDPGTPINSADDYIQYKPDADYFGSDSLTYTVCDNGTTNGSADTLCDSATVSITVTSVNDDPVANDDSAMVAEDDPATSIDVLTNDNDGPDVGETLTVTVVSDPTNGSATFTPTGVTYEPDADYFGSDSFTYTISDGNGGSDTATVSITVTEVNDAPIADDDSATVAEDDSVTTGILANDSKGPANESTQTLTVTAVTQGVDGTVTFTADDVTYTPDPDYNGLDSFTYTVCDDGTTDGVLDVECDTATVTITVTEVNDSPLAGDDSDTVAEDGSVTTHVLTDDVAGPMNEGGQTLTITLVSDPANGSASTDGSTVSYTPDPNYNDSDSFTYEVCDDGTTDGIAASLCDTATVNITVTEVNDDPIADDDSATVAEDSGATLINVLAGDVAGPANESGQTLTITLVFDPANGSASTDGITVTYTPDPDYNGSDSFTYEVCDDGTTDGVADSLCDTATVSITVTEVNDAPVISSVVAAPASFTENESSIVTVTFQDADAGQTHTCVFTWSDGGTTTVTVGAGVTTCAATHQYLDDNPSGTASDTYTVGVVVTDNGTTDGAPDQKSDTGSTSVDVNNAVPVITSITGPAGPQAKGTPSTVSASYTDVGSQDTHSCTFSWDDGTFSTVAGGGGACSATHTYVAAGVYTVSVTVTDDDTGSDTETMATFIVIYDPGAGFVTGGGWINVTAGSCRLTTVCEGAAGKANFGFVSKYRKGASIPDGQTEFQFQAGNLNFHSEAYEWLVVTGNKAQYRGTGRVNGITGYRFLLTAYDQSSDKFRIKIWRTSTNDVVFDSRMGQSDDIDAADPQAIAGGSVVIHK